MSDPPKRAKVHLRIEFGDTGFDSTVSMLLEDAEALGKLFWEAVKRAVPGMEPEREPLPPRPQPGALRNNPWRADERDQEPC